MEMVLLKVTDFDFRNSKVTLNGVKTSEYREGVLSGKLEAVLEDYLKVKKNESPYLFASERFFKREKPMTTKAASDMFHKICADAGITWNVTPHIMRHSYVTMQINAGTPVVAVSHLVGHKSLATTQQYIDTTKIDFSDARRHCT